MKGWTAAQSHIASKCEKLISFLSIQTKADSTQLLSIKMRYPFRGLPSNHAHNIVSIINLYVHKINLQSTAINKSPLRLKYACWLFVNPDTIIQMDGTTHDRTAAVVCYTGAFFVDDAMKTVGGALEPSRRLPHSIWWTV